MPTPSILGQNTPIAFGERDAYGNLISSSPPIQINPLPGETPSFNSGGSNHPLTIANDIRRDENGRYPGDRITKGPNDNRSMTDLNFMANMRGAFPGQNDYEQAISLFDPGNPTHPAPEGSSLMGFLNSNPGALSWLSQYVLSMSGNSKSPLSDLTLQQQRQ